MNSQNKRWIKQFVASQLDSNLDDIRRRLDARAISNGVDPFEAMEEYEYQVERVIRFLACY